MKNDLTLEVEFSDLIAFNCTNDGTGHKNMLLLPLADGHSSVFLCFCALKYLFKFFFVCSKSFCLVISFNYSFCHVHWFLIWAFYYKEWDREVRSTLSENAIKAMGVAENDQWHHVYKK